MPKTNPVLSIAFLFLISLSPVAQANELELLFYRAPRPLDWSSPGALIRSTFENAKAKISHEVWVTNLDGSRSSYVETVAYPHSISHVNVKLQCGTSPAIYKGMTGTKPNFFYVIDLIFRGDALETLITSTGGRFYKREEVLGWLPELKDKNYVRSLRLNLSDEQCQRAKTYLSQYEQLGLEKIYGGLRSDPRLGQGAGCSAFAASMLEVLGLDVSEIRNSWRRKILLPLDLTTTRAHRSKIGFLGFIGGENGSWAQRQSEPHIPVEFWDPELMYKWVGDVHAGRGNAPFPQKLFVSHGGNFKAVLWDVSGVPAARGELFKLGKRELLRNAAFHRENMDRVYSDEELKDPLFHECRAFRHCGN